ncbi:MAG: sugar transferase [Clostridia bacterium]|nr:sugar transferase [Clostridia bacterium]
MSSSLDYKKIVKKKAFSRFFIRFFDILISFFGIVFLLLFFAVIAVAIKCDSKGEVFFRQVRVGRNGKTFRIFKFRTMVKDAEKKGLQLSTATDSRITKVGKFLRKTKCDELPQLFNVFLGQMSFVGPRPEVPKYVEMYSEEQKNVLLIRPGITDEASILFRNENDILEKSDDPERTYIEEVMPKKLALNLEYLQKMGVFYNLKLIFKTIVSVVKE